MVLRLPALGFFGMSAVHLTLGLGADALLGAKVPGSARCEGSTPTHTTRPGAGSSPLAARRRRLRVAGLGWDGCVFSVV
jgi:hypothetical protein